MLQEDPMKKHSVFFIPLLLCANASAAPERIFAPVFVRRPTDRSIIESGGVRTAEKVCRVLLSRFGSDADHINLVRLATLAPQEVNAQLPVFLIEEDGTALNPANASGRRPLPPELATELSYARKDHNSQTVGVSLREAEPYRTPGVRSLTFAVRVAMDSREYRVTLAPLDKPYPNDQIAPGLIQERYGNSAWVWVAENEIEIPLSKVKPLIEATELSDNVSYIAANQIQQMIPEKILRQMRSYNLQDEMLEVPHNAEGLDFREGYTFTGGQESSTFKTPQYFVVRHPDSKERIGYMIMQEMIFQGDFESVKGLFEGHYGPGAIFGRSKHRSIFHYHAHFDLEGNRIERWTRDLLPTSRSQTELPLGYQASAEFNEQQFQITHQGKLEPVKKKKKE